MSLNRYDKTAGYSYTLGVFPTVELLLNKPEAVSRVYLSSKAKNNEGVLKIIKICTHKKINMEVNDRALEKISPKENCYAAGVFQKYWPELDPAKNHVALVNPESAGNLGTIIRTMLGFEVTELAVVKPGADIFSPEAIRASMGSIFKINFKYFGGFEEYSKLFPERNIYTFMTTGKTLVNKAVFKEPFSLVFGSESAGLPEKYQKLGVSVIIPFSKEIDSLNLSVAAGIALNAAKNGSGGKE